jgi:hypothetical protein
MATLLEIRTRLNAELGISADADPKPWTVAVRNQAIATAYAALWRDGIWKVTTDDITSVDDAQTYITTVEELYDVALVGSDGSIVGYPSAKIKETDSGPTLFLVAPIAGGYTLRVNGWMPYVSDFKTAGAFDDTKSDDLDAKYAELPILNAKYLLYAAQVTRYMAYSQHQAAPGDLNVTLEQLLGGKQDAKRDYLTECRKIVQHRPKISHPAFSRPR